MPPAQVLAFPRRLWSYDVDGGGGGGSGGGGGGLTTAGPFTPEALRAGLEGGQLPADVLLSSSGAELGAVAAGAARTPLPKRPIVDVREREIIEILPPSHLICSPWHAHALATDARPPGTSVFMHSRHVCEGPCVAARRCWPSPRTPSWRRGWRSWSG